MRKCCIIKQMWVDGDFGPVTPTPQTYPAKPSIIEIDYAYDAASNRTSIVDGREAPVWGNRDAQITVDDLHRLTEYERGNTLGSWSPAIGSQQWTYDLLGNCNVFEENKAGDGDYGDADEVENRSHNLA